MMGGYDMMKSFFVALILITISLASMALDQEKPLSVDRVMVKHVGDSIAEFVLYPDSMVANLTVWENQKLPSRVLPASMCSIVKYTLCQPVMYSTDKRVYSAFYADVRLVVYKGETFLTLELDYNINKWRLIDDKGKQICRHDLKNSELLSVMHELWPESRNINIKYDKFSE